MTFTSQLFESNPRKSVPTTGDSPPTFLAHRSKTNPAPTILRSENSPLPQLEHDSVQQSCAGKNSATPAAPTASSAKLPLSATFLRMTIESLATPRPDRERSSLHAETDARSLPTSSIYSQKICYCSFSIKIHKFNKAKSDSAHNRYMIQYNNPILNKTSPQSHP